MSEESLVVRENTERSRFELSKGEEIVGFADYRQNGTDVVVPYVETLRQHRGHGYGGQLVDGLLAILRADGRTITPQCPFAAGHIRANPAHHDLLTA